MRNVGAFIALAATTFAASLVLATYSRATWPPLVMSLVFLALILQVKQLKAYAPSLFVAYIFAFGAAWTKSNGLPLERGVGHLLYLGIIFGGLAFAVLALTVTALKAKTSSIAWISLAVLLGALVAWFSGNAGGADPLIAWLARHGFTGQTSETLVLIIRKSIHLAFYATFGVAAFRSSKLMWFALALPLQHAIFDEVRQHFFATNRTGQFSDVLVDLVGVCIGLAVVGAFKKRVASPTTLAV